MEDRKPSILYVDDEPQNLVSFKASFRRFYEVFTAQSGEEALQTLRQQAVSLIISDQRMPQMTGVELFEKILPEFPDPIRMVMTGYSDMEAIIQAINKGKVYYYITKPWKQPELKLVIDNALEAYRLKVENKGLQEEKNALLLKAERQEKENILSRFETLKNQVNPHFLFNCLNALSSLVHDDPDLAEDFISKLTKVYRYVLDFRGETLVPLEEELTVLKSYFFLQQIRFGNNLRMYTQVSEALWGCLIPPMTLQMLVENSIKHNIISREQPLTIELYTEEDRFFVVKNNYQKRTEKVDSTGVGLENLRARYAFISEEKPSFGIENGYYLARVPILREGDINRFTDEGRNC
ncbi:MAG: histidine kinase [Bacteroidia bacterium]|nr:histidine kinase [Bacteroidia bacterium]